ncbi:MAG: GNAT family N-acetyltransferase [Anaerolineaceae bacterium]
METRPAVKEDAPAIRALIRQVGINPLDLNWRHFLVMMDNDGKLAACGQIKVHTGGLRELASIAVADPYRGQGLARRVIEHLIEQELPPLYLTCRSSLESLYQKFGFHLLKVNEMPSYYRRLYRLARIFIWLTGGRETMSVMRRE